MQLKIPAVEMQPTMPKQYSPDWGNKKVHAACTFLLQGILKQKMAFNASKGYEPID